MASRLVVNSSLPVGTRPLGKRETRYDFEGGPGPSCSLAVGAQLYIIFLAFLSSVVGNTVPTQHAIVFIGPTEVRPLIAVKISKF